MAAGGGVAPQARSTGSGVAGAGPPFDPADMQLNTALGRLIILVMDHPHGVLAFLRRFWPVPKVPFTDWALITRYEDVKAALLHDNDVAVPFGPKISELNGGPNYLLGMQDGDDYRQVHGFTAQAFPAEEAQTVVAPLAAKFAGQLIDESGGRLDGIENLITRVPTRVSAAYYGLTIPDEVAFGQWTIAMSTFMFGDPANRPNIRKAALAAGEQMRPLVDAAIAKAKMEPPNTATITGRLVAAQAAGAPGLTDIIIRSILIGMVTGFVPTNTMASGHMLEMLLTHPDWLAQARAAAQADDDVLLEKCLFEAMRFMPLNMGPFRICARDYVVAPGASRATTLKAGSHVLVATQSAMFDPRNVKDPGRYNPGRDQADYMLFGLGLHWCIGAPLARYQITQTLKPLVLKNGLRRAPGKAGQLQTLGRFPAHLMVEFDA